MKASKPSRAREIYYYTYDGKVKAIRALESFVGGDVSGIVTNREHVAAFRNMTRSECLRVSPIKIVATGLVSR